MPATFTPVPSHRRQPTNPNHSSSKNSRRLDAPITDGTAPRTTPKRTPPSAKNTERKQNTRSSEKETPTVIFTGVQSQSPYVLNGESRANDSIDNNDAVMNDDASNEGDKTSHNDDGSTNHEQDQHQRATNMIQTTLECGIASICRLRKLFPSSFFAKMDVEGTSVTRFDVGLLEDILTGGDDGDEDSQCDDSERKSMTGESIGGRSMKKQTLSPLTFMGATQKTTNTEYTVSQKTRGSSRLVVRNDAEAKAATEALLLLRWIGAQGVNAIMRQNKLARVIFGINLPREEASDDELLEQYVFQFGHDQPAEPSQNLALTQARQDMSSFFQNLNGYSAGRSTLSQAVVPMHTQGSCKTHGTGYTASQFGSQFSKSAASRFEFLESERDDDKSVKSCIDYQSQKQSQRYRQSVASQSQVMSQMSIVESMTQSIRASVKRNRGVLIPKQRYLTLRVEFTESLTPSDLPEALKSAARKKFVSPKPKTTGFVITPLGTVAEQNCTGLSVAMTAYSKSIDNIKNVMSQDSSKPSLFAPSQFEIDELVLDETGFKPFTQIEDVEAEDTENDDVSNRSKVNGLESSTSRDDSRVPKRKQKATGHDRSKPQQKKSRCVSPNESGHFQPGTKAFGIPYSNTSPQYYVKCIVRDYRLDTQEYKVEFFPDCDLERKRQWIPAKKVVTVADLRKQVKTALERVVCDDKEEMIEIVVKETQVCSAMVWNILTKMT